jgi:hypothetical protein
MSTCVQVSVQERISLAVKLALQITDSCPGLSIVLRMRDAACV